MLILMILYRNTLHSDDLFCGMYYMFLVASFRPVFTLIIMITGSETEPLPRKRRKLTIPMTEAQWYIYADGKTEKEFRRVC